MNITLKAYKVASWTLLLGGLLHTLSDLFAPDTPERGEIILKMKELTGQALGTEFNMFLFFQGFSLMMGLLLMGYGALNILILKNNQQTHPPSNILILNLIIALVSTILCFKYFFIVPTLITGITLLGFTISYLAKTKLA